MERLTNAREAAAQRRAYEKRLEQGYPRNIPEERFLKLAAYEDTGLEPEDTMRLCTEDVILKLAGAILGVSPDRLRELTEASQAKRVVPLLMLSDLRSGSRPNEVFIISASGEVVEYNVCNIPIGPNNDGEVVTVFPTFDSCDFDPDDVGKRIFWDLEDAQHAAAALKENAQEG